MSVRYLLIVASCSFFVATEATAQNVDTDGDGLLDLIDVRGFDPDASGVGHFSGRGVQDLDGVSLLANLQEIELWQNQITSIEAGDFEGLSSLRYLYLGNPYCSPCNQITSIETGDFEGLANLEVLNLGGSQITSIEAGDFEGLSRLWGLVLEHNQIVSIETGDFEELTNLEGINLGGNRITSVEAGDFEGLASLQEISLRHNQITSIDNGALAGFPNLRTLELSGNLLQDLNLTGTTFEQLIPCDSSFPVFPTGFCVDGDEITRLSLDEASLSQSSFNVIVGETVSITDVSLVGLTFSDDAPASLADLLTMDSLLNVAIDQDLFNLYADEFMAFDARDGKSVTIVTPGDFDRDGILTVADINAMDAVEISNPRDPVFDLNDDGVVSNEDREVWVKNLRQTWFGDANLDGEFNSGDMVVVFTIGKYESGDFAGWADGDWDGDGDFTSGDLVLAFQDGGYEQGPRPGVNAVPEPSGIVMMMIALALAAMSSTRLRGRSS